MIELRMSLLSVRVSGLACMLGGPDVPGGSDREATVAEFEIRQRGRRVERFESDVDPTDEFACVALPKRRAREIRRPVEQLVLRTVDRRRRRWYEYRA
jgi:hypothetical protein